MRISLESVNNEITTVIKEISATANADEALFATGRGKRALIFFRTADGGREAPERLKPVAVALELLELGVRKHFGDSGRNYGGTDANLELITADRYYAAALRLVVALQDDRLIKILCEGLAEASEGYAFPEEAGSARRRDALAKAAHRLGCHMGGHREYKESTFIALIEEVDSALFPNPS